MHASNPRKKSTLDRACTVFRELVRIYPILLFDLLFILVQHWWIGSFLLLGTLGVVGVMFCLFSKKEKPSFLSLFFTWYLWRTYSFLVFRMALFVPEFLVLPLHTVLGTALHAYNAIVLPVFPVHVDVRIFLVIIFILNLIPFEERNPFFHWMDSVSRTFAMATAFLWAILFSHLQKHMPDTNTVSPAIPVAALSRNIHLFLSVEFALFAQMETVYPILLMQVLSYAYRWMRWMRTRAPVRACIELESVKVMAAWHNEDRKLYDEFAHPSLLEEHLAQAHPAVVLATNDPAVQRQGDLTTMLVDDEDDITNISSSCASEPSDDEDEEEDEDGPPDPWCTT